MKIKLILFVPLLLFYSCSLFKETILIKNFISEKEKFDKSDNPALKYLIINSLSKKKISLNDLLITDIRESEEINYQYCIIAEIDSEKGKILSYIYSEEIEKISKLIKGKSRINVIGDFIGFHKEYSFFQKDAESYFSKIDISDADIQLVKNNIKK